MDKEGSRQQQLLSFIPRHHKHYVLPSKTKYYQLIIGLAIFEMSFLHLFPCLSVIDSVNKKVHFSPHVQTDTRQHPYQARAHVQSSSMSLSVGCLLSKSSFSRASLTLDFTFSSCAQIMSLVFPQCVTFRCCCIKNSFLAFSFRNEVNLEGDSTGYD